MTVPVDLVDPTLLKDPVEEFFRQGGIDVPIEESDDKISAKKVALVGTALAASFLVYRMLMHKELDEAIAPSTKGEALKLIDRTFSRIAPVWARAALPAAVAAYRMGAYDATTISADELETLAQAYVKTLGEYINSTSAEAMADGFQAQLNARWSPELAWSRSVAGYGLDGPQTRSYVSSFSQGLKDGYIADPVPRASVKLVQTSLGMRAKRFGDTESWSAVQTGRNVIWMAQAAAGDLPEGTKKRWITAHDERVCPVCGPLDQRAILLTHKFHAEGKKFYAPGVHPNCRCRLELVYPDGYINRVEELIRKSRPGDPYNRDGDGQFARKESRGWTYREAMDDGEKHTTAPRRMRLRTLEAAKPATQQQTIFETEDRGVLGQGVLGGGVLSDTSSGVLSQGVLNGAPARTRTSAKAKPQTVTTIYVVTKTGAQVPVDIPTDAPTEGGKPRLPDPKPLGAMIFSLDAALSSNLEFYGKNGQRKSLTDYEPELGDHVTFTQGWDEDGTPIFDFGIDGLPSYSQMEENAIYEEQRRFGANAHDEFNYGEFVPDDIANPDTTSGGNIMVVFDIEDVVGYEGDAGDYVPVGSYKVSDIEDQEPTEKERAELGVTLRKRVTLTYINHTL